MASDQKLSVVVPAYNEAEVLPGLLTSLVDTMERIGSPFEIIIVNDGSNDGTQHVLIETSSSDSRLIPVQLSRNFGKEAALEAGLEASQGDAVLFIDADLQHPVEPIPEMVALWRAGYDVVNGRKVARGREVGLLYRLCGTVFDRVMSSALGKEFSGASDFKLLDRQAANAVMRCPERNRFFRGLVEWIGFETTDVEFEVQPRKLGKTRWRPWQLAVYSIANIISFSSLPLRLVTWLGVVTVAVGMGLAVQTLYNFVRGAAVTGFTTVILLLILLSGVILTSLGMIALYVAKMYDEQKARPLFLVREPRADLKRSGSSSTEDVS
jgi:dolichol-phosphate mannosyltransferase